MPKASFIAVVDDDQIFRESMVRLMRSVDYSVEAFASAHDFLSSSRFRKTSCLIADVQMPTMNGTELFRHLRDHGYAIPTILVTAYPNRVDRKRALKAGVVGYLPKICDENELMQRVRAALQGAGAPHRNL
jgi:FixJ family two-component response regulator